MKISVSLAIFNEEGNLRASLESVKDLAWEIVIVDGGSKDRSLEIAKSFGAKIIQTTNPSNFHINKNKAIDAASGDWILQLDADEVVSPQLSKEIKNVVTDRNYDGYWIARKNFFLGKFLTKGGQYPDYTLRLYRKGKGRLPGKDVHEQAEITGRVEYLNNALLHMGDKLFSNYINRWNRYTSLMATQIKNPNFVDYLFLKPLYWFIKAYFRHKGFVDGFPGFIFALFSSLRFPVAYFKYRMNHENRI